MKDGHTYRPPILRVVGERAFPGELVIDNFAGGGGASSGIEAAIGRPVDIAINHDARAIAMHEANHPETRHYVEDIWSVDPREACAGLPVGLVWFSPDCTHFSRARGTSPKEKNIRGLADVIPRWMEAVRPRVVVVENVPEFKTWGPLGKDGRPDKSRAGVTFRAWCGKIRSLGYTIDWQDMRAADYGAPTTRNRWFLVARRDGRTPAFPAPTHGEGLLPYRTAAECIDWSHPVRSIFNRKRPLAEATQRRIAMGIAKFVQGAGEPYIVRHGHYSKRTGAGLVEGKGAGLFRGQPLTQPLATICATNDKNLVIPYVAKHNGGAIGAIGQRLDDPLHTITARDTKALTAALLAPAGHPRRGHDVHAFLMKYYGSAGTVGQSLRTPLHTITTRDRFALVEIHGEPYRIVDIGMRMLQPGELYLAQGFDAGYHFEKDSAGAPFTKTDQIRMVGNSVSPPVAQAIVTEATRSVA